MPPREYCGSHLSKCQVVNTCYDAQIGGFPQSSKQNRQALFIEHGRPIDVTFVLKTNVGDLKAIYVEIHQLLGQKVIKVSNIYLEPRNNGNVIENTKCIKKVLETGSTVQPPFLYLLY